MKYTILDLVILCIIVLGYSIIASYAFSDKNQPGEIKATKLQVDEHHTPSGKTCVILRDEKTIVAFDCD